MAKLDMKKAMAGILNKGGSIFGNLEEIGAVKLSDLNAVVRKSPDTVYSLGRFEVREATKKHGSPYVTLELNGIVYSGYATALGNKLGNIIKAYGTCDGTHLFLDFDSGLEVTFKLQESEAGTYLDVYAVEDTEE